MAGHTGPTHTRTSATPQVRRSTCPASSRCGLPAGDHGRWRWRTAALTVAVVPTAATAARNAYWVTVAKIWSGRPSTIPSATAKPLAAAVSAHRAVSSAQHGPARHRQRNAVARRGMSKWARSRVRSGRSHRPIMARRGGGARIAAQAAAMISRGCEKPGRRCRAPARALSASIGLVR